MRFRTQSVLFAALSAGVSMVPMAAAAQSASSPPTAGELDEIVVTATREARALQDVPMSINVVTGKQIEQLNLFDAKDIQRLAPSLELTNSDGRSNAATLRGITFTPDQGTSPAVDIYLNDIPIDAQTAFTAIYDLEQIEVLRGPQGSLRGRTSPAGAITFRTRRPDLDEVNGYAQATATDDAAYNVQGGVSIPLIPGQLAVRVAALVDGNRLNQLYNVNRDEKSRSRTESARISLSWQPGETFNTTLTYQYLHADNRQQQQVFGPGNAPAQFDPTLSGPPADVDDYLSVAEGIRRYQNESHFVNLAFDWDLGPATLYFTGAHQYTVLKQMGDMDSANQVPNYVNIQSVRTPYNVDTAELRLASNGNSFWNWSIGTFYSKQTGDVTVTQQSDQFFGNFPTSMGLFLPITANTLVPVNNRTWSIAASSSFQFTDALRLEVAARYGNLKNIQKGILNLSSPAFPSPPPTDLIPPELAKTVNHPLTGGATLTYEFSDDVTAYAAYGRSFRAGTAGVSVPANISNDLIKTGSEKSDAFEIGVKTAFLDRRLTFNISAFYQKFDGYIARFPGINYDFGTRDAFGVPSGPPDGIVDGAFDFNYNGDATVKGVEATLAGRPVDAWDFSVSASYIKARYDDALLPCNDFNGDGAPDSNGAPAITGGGNISYCASDDRLADTPDFSLTANSELRFGTGDLQPFVRALFTYRPGVFSERAAFDYQSRELLNLYTGLRGPDARWEVTVFAKNLLNQKRITSISQGNALQPTLSGTPYDSGYRLINATNPREFGVTTSFKF
ncbi:iron complex outermembrane recepter protein [Sphingomonas laterariae]|uniref:Iron complex outermembrane recepter protein n=1 Tax=Edaphosphingomonas laterariae TaxID=861865 RepID=A0A239DH08_9SPHN|nr:TonB-dependent receptor [Sphingomonas laterariae]SNS31064.1 iron complex outermembrane recepter protein [Sphingomonas laterariae]